MSAEIDKAPHYNSHPSGVECIDIVEGMPFNLGNAWKYAQRCGHKGDALVDLQKARYYLKREIVRRRTAARQRLLPREILVMASVEKKVRAFLRFEDTYTREFFACVWSSHIHGSQGNKDGSEHLRRALEMLDEMVRAKGGAPR